MWKRNSTKKNTNENPNWNAKNENHNDRVLSYKTGFTRFLQDYRWPCLVSSERNVCRHNLSSKIICFDGSMQFQERETTELHIVHMAATTSPFSSPSPGPIKGCTQLFPLTGIPFPTGKCLPPSLFQINSPVCWSQKPVSFLPSVSLHCLRKLTFGAETREHLGSRHPSGVASHPLSGLFWLSYHPCLLLGPVLSEVHAKLTI